MNTPDLFDIGERTKADRPAHKYPTPDLPGTGPEGETCGTCAHRAIHGKISKCRLMQATWTHGEATDIKARWEACSHWESELRSAYGRKRIVLRFWPTDFPKPQLPSLPRGGRWAEEWASLGLPQETLDAIAIAADWWEDAGFEHQAAMLRAVVDAERQPLPGKEASHA